MERLGAQSTIGDMAETSVFRHLRATREFEYIIHAAQAPYHTLARSEIDRLEKAAVRNLELLSSPVTRLMIFTGGVWSYGTGGGGLPINEQTPQRPFLAARQRVTLTQDLLNERRFPWLVLDPPSLVYGTTGPAQTVARALKDGATIDVLDDERVSWSVIERLDLGQAYLALLTHGRAGDSLLVAEDEPVSVAIFYETLARLVGSGHVVRKPLSAFVAEDENAMTLRTTSQPIDSFRLKTTTGWHARESFLTSMGKYIPAG